MREERERRLRLRERERERERERDGESARESELWSGEGREGGMDGERETATS